MIRLLESDNPDIKLYDTVSYAGYNWIVIGIEGGIATLLTESWVGHVLFEDSPVEEGYNYSDYRSSHVRFYLMDDVLSELLANGAKPLDTRLIDADCTDPVFLLSALQAQRLPDNIRRLNALGHRDWWLRTTTDSSDGSETYVDIIQADGKLGKLLCNSRYAYVRPAMRVRLEDLA